MSGGVRNTTELASTHVSLFKVVEHPLFEDEPTFVFGLVPPSLLREPPLSLRVEERLCQTTLPVRDLELFLFDLLIEVLHEKGSIQYHYTIYNVCGVDYTVPLLYKL